eukprot:m.112200 g.112200  ORF g.112200 m.112200 type:complete len:181 (+) comp9108_c0_seq2:1879-2421(+)
MALQATLAILKPDIASHARNVQMVMGVLARHGLTPVRTVETAWDEHSAKLFYAEHKERFFHQRLVEHMTSGRMIALALVAPNAISTWRSLLGTSKTYRSRFAAPESLRAMFGISDTRNAFHGSDSPSSAARELAFFFPTESCESLIREYEMLDPAHAIDPAALAQQALPPGMPPTATLTI